MFKFISAAMLSLLVLSSCNTTAQFQKSFDNNEGVLAISLNYQERNLSTQITQQFNVKLTLVVINVDTKQKLTKSVPLAVHNKFVVMSNFAPGEYEVVESYYLRGTTKETKSEESIFFTVEPGEFTVLPDQLNFSIYEKDNTYWISKQFSKMVYRDLKDLKLKLEGMMPATAQ